MRANRRFTLLWAGQAISQLGSRTYGVAYMLWVLAETGSLAATGVVASVTLGVFTAAQLAAGWLADRCDRRWVMLGCDAASAAAALSLCVAAAQDAFSLVHLLVAAVVLGAGWAIRGTAELASLPDVVAHTELGRAAALNGARGYAAGLLGPPLAGVLFAVAPALPFLVDAVSYLAALLCTAAIRGPLRAQVMPERESWTAELRAGLRLFWDGRFIRASAALDATVELAVSALGLVVIVLLADLDGGPSAVGLVLGLGSAGGLIGAALVAARRRRALPARGVLILAPALGALCVAGVAVAGSVVAVAIGYGAFFVLRPAWSSVLETQWLTLIDEEHRGRVLGSINLVTAAPLVAAPVLTGVLLELLGTRGTALLLAALLAAVAAAATTLRPLRPRPV
ncbi:MAG TPA: MFS transporter [Solirubrobacteraceae bacterium]|nr:MFS transporter [Solirubrobacteraceae bacterium]